ncbi:MAG: hypothetical protein M3367_14590 [Acidobacteriota bacterium]|nr:hypothetical protein [Acidobacteriota bacterium]
MDSIYTVQKQNIENLGAEIAVEFFSKLLWAEANKIGLPLNKINITSRINVADGGVDASVKDSSVESELIRKGETSYQIKTGDTFKPTQEAQIRKEFFGKSKQANVRNLAKEIKACLDKDGTYILVCFGQDFTDNEIKKAKTHIGNFLKQCNYKNPKIEVWGINQLRSFFSNFPSLALTINGQDNSTFQSHSSWSEDAEMRREPFESEQEQQNLINNIQDSLRDNINTQECTHIRIFGEAGAGKTRLVLEATRIKDLSSLVIYCNAENFRDSQLMSTLLREDNTFWVILVLDECNEENRSYIQNKFQFKGKRIKIISITNEFERTSGRILPFEVEKLTNHQISSIIQSYVEGMPSHHIDSWAAECGGFPRFAHFIGYNLSKYPDDILRTPDTVEKFWERFIVGYETPNSEKVQQTFVVIRHLALFSKFGSPKLENEAKIIWGFINSADSSITRIRFVEIINELRKRKILQGEYTFYISPKILHVKLWLEFWEKYEGITPKDFFEKLSLQSPQLSKWFLEMFEYAKNSFATQRIVQDLLAANGIFQDLSFLDTEIGGDFFLALSKADPKSSVKALKRIIDNLSKEELLTFIKGRRQIVWSLERMAEWKDIFPDVARVLLKLGEAENESYANNASAIFINLFSNAYDEFAPSEATPEQKIPVLKEAFKSSSKEQRILALKACDKALEIDHFGRSSGTHGEAFHSSPKRWMPKTDNELFDAYRNVWNLILEVIDNLPEDERKEAVDILLRNSFGIGRVPALAEMVINTIQDLLNKSYLERNAVLASLTKFLWRDNERKKRGMQVMDAGVKQKWEDFNKEIAPKDFSSLLQRYVALDIHIEKYSEETGFATDLTKPIIEDLAQQALDNPASLKAEIDWLITEKAKRGYDFGYALGQKDKSFTLLLELIQVHKDKIKESEINLGLLGGYFRALREVSEESWESILDTLAKGEQTKIFIPALSQMSGLTEKGAVRIADLFEKNEISFWELNRFQYGLQIQNLSENTLKRWIKFLLAQTDAYAISIALNYLYQYYIEDSHSKNVKLKLPKDLAFKALTHKTLFDESQQDRFDQMSTYYWELVGRKFVSLFKDKALKFAEILIKNFGKDGCLNRGLDEAPISVLNEVSRKFSLELWRIASSQIRFPIDKKTMRIKFWLEKGVIQFGNDTRQDYSDVPLEELWKWIDEKIEKRAWFVAWFVPSIIAKSENKSPVARELLIRYGDREDVRNNLYANFGTTGVITGNMSEYYQRRLDEFNEYRKKEDNPRILQWLDDYIEQLKLNVEQSRIREERRF